MERYYRYSRYLKERFGRRIFRVPLDAGFTCPTRDGSISTGGCLYCGPRGSAAPSAERVLTIREQMIRGMEIARRRYRAQGFIAYFQAFTNTYGPPAYCAGVFAEAVDHDGVVGLSIGTRPDCVPDEMLDVVSSFASRCDTWIEYGLQSAHDSTLRFLRRGHTAEAFADAVRRTRARGIKVCAHVILGLPGEDRRMMLGTARFLAGLPVDGVKIHLLHVLRGSALEMMFRKGGIRLLARDDYVPLVCDFLELLPPGVVIQRLTGEAPRGELVAPLWALDKAGILRAINAELEMRDSRQGILFRSTG